MAPRRKRRRKISDKTSSLSSLSYTQNVCPEVKLSLDGSLTVVKSKTRKLQRKQRILPEKVSETLKLIGLQDSTYNSKDTQIRGILNYLKDSKIGTYVSCSVCNTWLYLSDIKDVQEIPGRNLLFLRWGI